MLCDICKKRVATTHYKQIVNDKVTEMYLCSKCAAEQGYSNIFGSIAGQMERMFGSVFSNAEAALPDEKRCGVCGASFSDIVKEGRVGCAECYNEFYEKIMPSVKRIHGNTCYVGKKPKANDTAIRLKTQAEILRDEMNKAVEEENFELAAKLRDEIKALEENGNE